MCVIVCVCLCVCVSVRVCECVYVLKCFQLTLFDIPSNEHIRFPKPSAERQTLSVALLSLEAEGDRQLKHTMSSCDHGKHN